MTSLETLFAKLRDEHGITQGDVAGRLGMDPTQLSRIIHRKRRFSIELARRLSDMFTLSWPDRGKLLAEVDSYKGGPLTDNERRAKCGLYS